MDTNNYRPISILPVLSKIMERFVHIHFSSFLEQNRLISEHQSGFRKSHSTTTALLDVTNRWLKNIEQGKLTGVVFIDLRKAFDTVDITIALHKLRHFGISQESLEHKWFTSYLTGRKQTVCIDEALSNPLPVNVGVPQGSILGPLVFILYLNDLPSSVKNCNSGMYADDTEIDFSSKSVTEIETKINDDLNSLTDFFQRNKLSLNIKKCEYMTVGTKHKTEGVKLDIKVDDQVIEQVPASTHLGSTIDENLKWTLHINKLIKKLSSKIGILRKLKTILPTQTLITLYNAIILPHFDYADIIYEAGNKGDLDRLQRLQTKAARIISGTSIKTSRINMFKSLKWLTLANRRTLNKCTMMYKCMNNSAPPYLVTLFANKEHSHNTRHSSSLHVPRARTEYYKKSFEVSGACAWNNLPDSIKYTDSICSFKSRLKEYLSTLNQF